MHVRTELFMTMLAVTLVMCGCGNDKQPVLSLEEYAKRDCAISTESKQKLVALNKDFLSQVSHREVLADTVGSIAQVFSDTAVKAEELGDPPNGEGAGSARASAEAMRQLGKRIELTAAAFRTAQTGSEFTSALNDFQKALFSAGPYLTEFKSKYPTPELDKVEESIPGCRSSN